MPSRATHQLRPRSLPQLQLSNYVVYIFFALVLLFFALTIGGSGFLSMTNLFSIARTTAMVTIMAVAMTFVISAGELDLSVGSTAALSALVGALVMQAGMPWPLALLAALGSGLAVGCLNGFSSPLSASRRSSSPSARCSSSADSTCESPTRTRWRSRTRASTCSSGLENCLACRHWCFGHSIAIIGHVVLKYTRFGPEILATGGNRLAAEYSGVKVRRVKFTAFLISGAAAALAGLLYSGMMQTARFNFGEGAEPMAIAAVILGGTSLYSGRGTIIGTVVRSLLIGMINNGLIIMGLDVSEQMMVAGAIIILDVAFGKKPTA
jgi:ribose transport system permease protein